MKMSRPIAVCFLMIQGASSAGAQDARHPGSDAGTAAYGYAADYSGAVILIPSSDSLTLRAGSALIEDILQEIADKTRTTLSFPCDDPAENRVEASQTLAAPDVAQLLRSFLGRTYPDHTVRPLEATAQDGDKGFVIALSGKDCAPAPTPVRVYRPIIGHPLMTKSGGAITTDELASALRTEGPKARFRAAHLLAGVDFLANVEGPEALSLLREAVRDPHPRVMLMAAEGLAKLGPRYGQEEAAKAIHDRLREDRYYELVIALARLDGQSAWPVLEELMASPDQGARRIALTALFLTTDARAVAWLSQVALTGEMDDARKAAMTIGKIGGREAESALIDILRRGDSDHAARAAQGAYFLPESDRANAEAEIGRLLRTTPEIEDLVVGLSALSFFGPLESLLSDARVAPELKSKVLGILETQGTERAIGTIVIALADPAWPVRLQAVNALGTIGTVDTAPHLIGATHDDRPAVRAAALFALSSLAGAPPEVAALAQGLSDPSEEARKAAIDAFEVMGRLNEQIERVLIKAALTSDDSYVSDMASTILRRSGVVPDEFCVGKQAADPELCGPRPAQ